MLPVLERYELPATLYATTWYSGRALPVVNLVVDYLVAASGRSTMDSSATRSEIEALPCADRLEALRRFGRELGVAEDWLELRQFHIMSPAELADARQRGLDIQLHTHRHINVTEQVERLAREVLENREFLAGAIGEMPLTHFCYPSGTFHPRAPALLAALGVRSSTLVEPGLNAPGTDPYRLRRLLDGRRVSDAEFDAYLSGLLHFTQAARTLLTAPLRQRAQGKAGQAQLIAAE
jgi:peptidoglycan/xylan/chitin deacetylase (PgdA/CDA1 family)